MNIETVFGVNSEMGKYLQNIHEDVDFWLVEYQLRFSTMFT